MVNDEFQTTVQQEAAIDDWLRGMGSGSGSPVLDQGHHPPVVLSQRLIDRVATLWAGSNYFPTQQLPWRPGKEVYEGPLLERYRVAGEVQIRLHRQKAKRNKPMDLLERSFLSFDSEKEAIIRYLAILNQERPAPFQIDWSNAGSGG